MAPTPRIAGDERRRRQHPVAPRGLGFRGKIVFHSKAFWHGRSDGDEPKDYQRPGDGPGQLANRGNLAPGSSSSGTFGMGVPFPPPRAENLRARRPWRLEVTEKHDSWRLGIAEEDDQWPLVIADEGDTRFTE